MLRPRLDLEMTLRFMYMYICFRAPKGKKDPVATSYLYAPILLHIPIVRSCRRRRRLSGLQVLPGRDPLPLLRPLLPHIPLLVQPRLRDLVLLAQRPSSDQEADAQPQERHARVEDPQRLQALAVGVQH